MKSDWPSRPRPGPWEAAGWAGGPLSEALRLRMGVNAPLPALEFLLLPDLNPFVIISVTQSQDPDQCDAAAWALSRKRKVTSSSPSQGMCLGCGFGPGRGTYDRQPVDMPLVLYYVDVSFPPFPSL